MFDKDRSRWGILGDCFLYFNWLEGRNVFRNNRRLFIEENRRKFLEGCDWKIKLILKGW